MAAPLYIGFLQGEALLRLTFFSTLIEKSFSDPDNQNLYWQKLIEERNVIQQVVEHSQIHYFFNLRDSGTNDDESYKQLCFAAFCIVLWDMSVTGNEKLANRTINSLITHFVPQLFPKKPVYNSETAKKEIAKLLSTIWARRPELKESFNTTADEVTYSLIAKLPDHAPVTLLTLTGKRLKPTRQKTCAKILSLLEMGALKLPEPQANKPKRKQPQQPFFTHKC